MERLHVSHERLWNFSAAQILVCHPRQVIHLELCASPGDWLRAGVWIHSLRLVDVLVPRYWDRAWLHPYDQFFRWHGFYVEAEPALGTRRAVIDANPSDRTRE